MLYSGISRCCFAGMAVLLFCVASPNLPAKDELATSTDRSAQPPSDFFFQDGDRVVFLGDSLTASRKYGEIVERYTLSTYPKRRVRFINAGMGGDTAAGGLKRLEKTVLVHKPTVVTVCYGVNDIGWGLYANERAMEKYLIAMRGIIDACQKAGARVVVMTPCPTKLPNPEKGNPDILQEMGRRVLAMARKMGAHPIDLYTGFREIQRSIRRAGKDEQAPTHASDGIHLSDLGNLAFAYVLLRGLGAPECMSSAEIDAEKLQPLGIYRCSIREIKQDADILSFSRLDEGWPLHLGSFANLDFPHVPSHQHLSRYELKVKGMQGSGPFMIRVEGKPLTTVTLGQLEQGVNLAYASPGVWDQFPPWKAQGAVLDYLIQARSQISLAGAFSALVLPNDPRFAARFQNGAEKKVDQLEELAYQLVRPKPLRFEIGPASALPMAETPARRKMSEEELADARATLESPWAMEIAKDAIRKMLNEQSLLSEQELLSEPENLPEKEQ